MSMRDDFQEYRTAQKERRAERLPVRAAEIMSLSEEGYKVVKLTEYQYRINDRYDLYPIHNRWHDLKTNKRGGASDLCSFIKKNIQP